MKRAGVSPSAKPSPELWPDRRSLRVAKSLEACALAGVRPQYSGGFFWVQKKPAASYSRTGESRTTLGDEALDFSVRNGNWYDCLSMATG